MRMWQMHKNRGVNKEIEETAFLSHWWRYATTFQMESKYNAQIKHEGDRESSMSDNL